MRIGIIMHPYGERKPGGLPRIISGWTEALLSVDSRNEYVIFLKEKPSVPPALPGGNWRVEVLGRGRFWLDRLRRHTPCDVYLFNTPVLPFFWKPPRAVVIVLDYPYKYLPARNFFDRCRRYFISWYHHLSLKRADHILAVSESTRRDTIRFFGVPKEKTSVIYHGFKKICELPEKPVSLPEKFFFFAGTMKERKNVMTVIKSFELFRRSSPAAPHRLVLSGKNDGRYFRELAAYIRSRNLQDSVLFTGHLSEPELAFAYKRAEALIFPSIVEGTGFPVLEAMGCGLPVITSNIFGPAELGANGGAILVNPRSAEEIAAAMRRIVFNPAFREEQVKRGFAQASRFSWTNTGRETLALLEMTARRRICFLAHNLKKDNGGGVLARNIITGLRDSLCAVASVITAVRSDFPDERVMFSAGWFYSLRNILVIRRVIKQSDVVHTFDLFPYGLVGALFTFGSGKLLIITATGTGSVRYLYTPWLYPALAFVCRRAQAIAAISSFTRREMEKRLKGVKILVINPGIDPDEFKREIDPRKTAAVRSLTPFILSVGSLRFRKGYKYSIPAFKVVAERFPNLRYVIVGKKYTDKEYNRIRKLIAENALEDKVLIFHDLDDREELIALYKAAELFCLMSINIGHDVEGFGFVFLEAAAAGLPVVGIAGCGVEDATAPGQNGILVPELDAEAFSQAIISILSDDEKRKAMRTASQRLAENFSWPMKIGEYVRIYKTLLPPRGA